jgi:hypothetical protein
MSATNEDQAGALPADLAAIAAAADAQIAGAAELLPGEQAPPAAPDRGAEFAAMLSMAIAMAAPALPFLPKCYPPEVCAQIGTAFAAVADKHGWKLDALQSPELALAVVAIPPTISAIVQGRQYAAWKRDQVAKAEQAARAAKDASSSG